jgi:hypothetical protein
VPTTLGMPVTLDDPYHVENALVRRDPHVTIARSGFGGLSAEGRIRAYRRR